MTVVVGDVAAATILANATTTTAPEDVAAVGVAKDVDVGVDADVGGDFPSSRERSYYGRDTYRQGGWYDQDMYYGQAAWVAFETTGNSLMKGVVLKSTGDERPVDLGREPAGATE